MYVNSFLPFLEDSAQFAHLIQLCYQIGYQAAYINLQNEMMYQAFINSPFFFPTPPSMSFPITMKESIKYRSAVSPLILIPRTTLTADTVEELIQKLRIWITRRCLIAVEFTSKEIAEVAARDGRVDILSISNDIAQKELTKGIISLTKQNQCALELSITPILAVENQDRTRLLRNIHRILLMAKPQTHMYILGSGAGVRSNPWLLRGPIETMAVFVEYFQIPESISRKMVESNGEIQLLRFIKRDQNAFVEPGVEIVDIKKQGGDLL